MDFDHIVMGLGNPGPRYSLTRHNAGFIALDVWLQNLGGRWLPAGKGLSQKINAETADIRIQDKRVLLVKPQTFMNLSGESLNRLYLFAGHLRGQASLTVVHDEIDLDLGKVRIKFGGGDAGHNGLKSIRGYLGHGDFYRCRIGVSKPPEDSHLDVADWVLQEFSDKDQEILFKSIDKTIAGLEALIEDPKNNLTKAQNLASKDSF